MCSLQFSVGNNLWTVKLIEQACPVRSLRLYGAQSVFPYIFVTIQRFVNNACHSERGRGIGMLGSEESRFIFIEV